MFDNLKILNVEPATSNKNFGIFFGALFGVLGAYLYWRGAEAFIYTIGLSVAFLFFAYVYPQMLSILNKSWFILGRVMGLIVSPIVIVLIYGFLFVPVGLVMRLFKRDRLSLNSPPSLKSMWVARDKNKRDINFSDQF